MAPSVVLAQEETTLEVTVAGRQSYSEHNTAAKLVPLIFEKAGNATVAAFGGRKYNLGKTPLKIQRVHLSCVGAPVGSALTVDVLIDGTSVFAAAGDRVSVAAANTAQASVAVPTKTGDAITVKPGQYVTVAATVIGTTTAATDVVVAVVLG